MHTKYVEITIHSKTFTKGNMELKGPWGITWQNTVFQFSDLRYTCFSNCNISELRVYLMVDDALKLTWQYFFFLSEI